jgi:hypothetical protein
MDADHKIKRRRLNNKSSTSSTDGLESLSQSLFFSAPREVYLQYLDYMDVYDVPKASLVCKFFRNYFKSERFLGTLRQRYEVIPKNDTSPKCIKSLAFYHNIEKYDWDKIVMEFFMDAVKTPLTTFFLKDVLKSLNEFKFITSKKGDMTARVIMTCAILLAHLYPNCNVAIYNKLWDRQIQEKLDYSAMLRNVAKDMLPEGSRVLRSLISGEKCTYGNICLVHSSSNLRDFDFILIDNFATLIGYQHYNDIIKLGGRVIAAQSNWNDIELDGFDVEDLRGYGAHYFIHGVTEQFEYRLPYNLRLLKRIEWKEDGAKT